MKNAYRNKKTGQIVITGEKLDGKYWELVRRDKKMNIRNTKMKKREVIKK